MQAFSEREFLLLTAICDTLAPSSADSADSTLMRRKASDLGTPALMASVLPQVVDDAQLAELKLSLHVLEQPLLNAAIGGVGKSLLDMTLDERTQVLQAWSTSPIPHLRKGFQAFKRLTLFLFYTAADGDGRNPAWAEINYPDPPVPPARRDKPIRPLSINADTTLTADVVIVGSGAGGGVVAGELSAAGLDVIVVEKGGYYAEQDFSGREMASTDRMFENRGMLASRDLGVVVLAGSTLGGGSMINWCAAFRTPEHVLAEWERDLGVTGFTDAHYQASLDAVSARINVNTDESHPNFQNAALARGGEACGYQIGVIPRNVKGCGDCGFCNYGCTVGGKQSTVRTYLQDCHDRGGRIIVNTHVEQVLVERGAAVGVTAHTTTANGQRHTVTLRARAVVVAAGALHTPAILMRSGLTNANIGRHLHLHPTSVTYGMYNEPACGWSGPIMTRYVSEFSRLDDGYGVSLQTAPVHPGIAALVLPWADGLQHKRMMLNLAHLTNIIVITRDRFGGQVRLRRDGSPVIHYTLSDYDRAHLQRGLLASLNIHRAAGAVEIGSSHISPINIRVNEDHDFDGFIGRVTAAGLRPNSAALLSAHQMSSCRMGGNPARGALNPTGESFEVRNLFVADGSALPTALGINPMLTIMGVAHHISQHIKARLTN